MTTEPLKHEDPLRDWLVERVKLPKLRVSSGLAKLVLALLGTACLYGIAMAGFWPGGWSLAVAMKPAGLWVTAAICFHRLAG